MTYKIQTITMSEEEKMKKIIALLDEIFKITRLYHKLAIQTYKRIQKEVVYTINKDSINNNQSPKIEPINNHTGNSRP